MSMLAERKRKQKWSLNPRGKAWSEDGNKFGQKLLEKMGWQTGKGLGAKEDGITEHIKVSYKNDSKGMGFKESDQLTEHESNFTALLESLTGTAVDTNIENLKLKSLEKKSRVSRVRLHYHKFTKGKDLSSRSEKELANIFGKKTLRKMEKKVEEDVPVEENEPKTNGMLINSGSMADYFKSKLPAFNKPSKEEESESEGDVRVGFGFKTPSKDKCNFKRKLKEEDTNTFSPRKKVKSGDNGFVNPAFNPLNNQIVVERHSLEVILESSLENVNIEENEHKTKSLTDTTLEVSNKPKKKKNKSKDCSENTYENDINSYEDLENSENTSELSQYEIKLSSKKKKKLKRASENANCTDASEPSENLERTTEQEAIELKKKKKSTGIENKNFEHVTSDEPEQVAELKKKKKKKNKSRGIENPNFEDYNIDVSQDNAEVVQTEKSRKRKHENLQNGIENLNFEEQDRNEVKINDHSDLSKKHKRKNLQAGIDNPNFEDNIANTSQHDPEVIYYENLLKHVNLYNGIDNPSFEQRIRDEPSQNGDVLKRISKKHSSEIQNSNINDSSDTLNESGISETVQNTKSKKKKKKKTESINDTFLEETLPVCNTEIKKVKSKKKSNEGIDVTCKMQENLSGNLVVEDNPYEVKVKNKKKQLKSDVSNINEESQISSDTIDYSDLMLNTVSTPVISTPQREPKAETDRTKRRKSVRFNDVPQRHIIPNNEQLRIMEEGIDNVNFDEVEIHLQENMEQISNTIDRFQAEIENDINEKKVEEIMVGEMDKPDGPNEKLPDGTRLKFRHVRFDAKMPNYFAASTGPKKSYKHLIKGDIIVKFKNTNLHEIQGYGTKKKPRV